LYPNKISLELNVRKIKLHLKSFVAINYDIFSAYHSYIFLRC